MNQDTPIIDSIAESLWRQASTLMLGLESGCSVDELRQRVLQLAGAAGILRGFPPQIMTTPLGLVPDTVPAEWLTAPGERAPQAAVELKARSP